MKMAPFHHTPHPREGLQGIGFVLTPAPLLLSCHAATAGTLPMWILFTALGAGFAFWGGAFLHSRHSHTAQLLGFLALAGCAVTGIYTLPPDPLYVLIGGALLIQAVYVLITLPSTSPVTGQPHSSRLFFDRARYSLFTLAGLALLTFPLNPDNHPLGEQAMAGSVLISQLLLLQWLWACRKGRLFLWWLGIPLLAGLLTVLGLFFHLIGFSTLAVSLFCLWFLPQGHWGLVEQREQWWTPFLDHPARALISTFFGLCLLGTLLLQRPWATAGDQSIPVIDAAFTSVSAVCVTGLVVLDTAKDFSLFGQSCLLLLIQLGGLGIMTITTIALHVIGKRLSLRQERLLTSLTETNRPDLIRSLLTIVRFTLLTECTGAILLFLGFWLTGTPWHSALWKGVFTSISAFCNAGFALDSTSLILYQHSPIILCTVATLIILGGLAPVTCLLVPQWIRGRQIGVAPRIALVTSTVLLLVGTCSFLVFEWEQSLADLSLVDKLCNAWFQSVTLRTAGFNSVELEGMLAPTLLLALCWMFIGGSPGGTAGGIKTTTIGILAVTFWATVRGQTSVMIQNRKINEATINRAITICAAGIIVLLAAFLALSLTQPLPARALMFEVISALGTVGLSLGMTPDLDSMGKIIIMLTMFIGRVGPMTLFTLLSTGHQGTGSRYPDARITLT
jgi:trk system potassium uptake protein TrkH